MLSVARAPSNIALIKYMGKDDSEENLPSNGSLSLTLDSLCSIAEVRAETSKSPSSRWSSDLPSSCSSGPARDLAFEQPRLSESGVARILRHVERVRIATPSLFNRHSIAISASELDLELRTVNTFPVSSGIASSASSFAAVTLAVARALARDAAVFDRAYQENLDLRRDLSSLSRRGSGSSCRSFEGPWVIWEKDSAAALSTSMPELTDFVLVIGSEPKQVSSTEAHSRVRTSPLWEGRAERVEQRMQLLESALAEADLKAVSRIAWAETWEMHSLFHTCAEPFTYWEPGTLQALRWLMPWVQNAASHDSAPPIVTMDAGANVHVLVPSAEASVWQRHLADGFPELRILRDHQGKGASVL